MGGMSFTPMFPLGVTNYIPDNEESVQTRHEAILECLKYMCVSPVSRFSIARSVPVKNSGTYRKLTVYDIYDKNTSNDILNRNKKQYGR